MAPRHAPLREHSLYKGDATEFHPRQPEREPTQTPGHVDTRQPEREPTPRQYVPINFWYSQPTVEYDVDEERVVGPFIPLVALRFVPGVQIRMDIEQLSEEML